jgi:hypothetical protein
VLGGQPFPQEIAAVSGIDIDDDDPAGLSRENADIRVRAGIRRIALAGGLAPPPQVRGRVLFRLLPLLLDGVLAGRAVAFSGPAGAPAAFHVVHGDDAVPGLPVAIRRLSQLRAALGGTAEVIEADVAGEVIGEEIIPLGR